MEDLGLWTGPGPFHSTAHGSTTATTRMPPGWRMPRGASVVARCVARANGISVHGDGRVTAGRHALNGTARIGVSGGAMPRRSRQGVHVSDQVTSPASPSQSSEMNRPIAFQRIHEVEQPPYRAVTYYAHILNTGRDCKVQTAYALH